MLSVWEVKMRGLLCLMLAVTFVMADKNDNRRNKLPFVADAVGNSLPPPSNVPATVGSPVNLLTPDRYEFYTFDESGELVKRLMTLEEIQAIVAAGEDTEGLVTFANDNQPTVSFNINQPPYTKVHSVVTNVQNVLKAQMEAHKNKPPIQPTLDTPDVSDSWSLILPSIFGNSGVDIVFDKSSGSVTTPETETFEEQVEEEDNSLSKEGTNQVISSSTTKDEDKITTTEMALTSKVSTTTTTTTTTTTPKPTTTTTPKPTTTTTLKPPTTAKAPTTTTRKPATATTKRSSPATFPTKVPSTSLSQSKATNKPRITTTTAKPTTPKLIIRTTAKVTSPKPEVTTKKQSVSDSTVTDIEDTKVQIQPNSNSVSSTEKNLIELERISTFIPMSTVKYVTERTTRKPYISTKNPVSYASTTKRSVTTTAELPSISTTQTTKAQLLVTTSKPFISTVASSTERNQDVDKINTTTITTQSVSPWTTVSSTEYLSADKIDLPNDMQNKPNAADNDNNEKDVEPLLLFDVAQSISQIASDLGGDFQPIPTTSNLPDTTNNSEDLESKEILDMDIPSGAANGTDMKTLDDSDKNIDNFIKISTIDPHDSNQDQKPEKVKVNANDNIKITEEKESTEHKNTNIVIDTVQKVEFTIPPVTTESTSIDPFLSESMGDLLSQVANEAPSIVDTQNNAEEDAQISTTEKSSVPTVVVTVTPTTIAPKTNLSNNILTESLSEISNKVKKDTSTTTESAVQTDSEEESSKLSGNKKPTDSNNNTPAESTQDKKYENKVKPNDIKESINKDLVKEKVSEIDLVSKNDSVNNNISANDKIPANKKKPVLNITEINEQNFVQISGSVKKNDIKVTSVIVEKETKDQSPLNATKDNQKTSQSSETPIMKEENKPIANEKENISQSDKHDNTNSEITTVLPEESIPETTIETIKINQGKINKIPSKDKTNAFNKKERLPEPLPKVDDFKKKIQKVNIDDEELVSQRNNSWKLIPTLSPPKANEIPKDKVKSDNNQYSSENNDNKDIVLEFSNENQGLEVTTKDLGDDIARFSELSNELAFRYWNVIVDDIDKRRSFVFSPYSTFSMLAMIFMGARGATSGEMNEILKLDDMVTFNPHFTLKNISDSIEPSPQSGVAVSAFIRELYSDRNKGKILTFYKERAQHFYNGHVEEINFKLISDIIRRRTNLLVKRYSWGKIPEYMKTNNIVMQAPLAAFTTNIFQTDCSGTSVDGRDGEMYFVVSPNVRQRRLVPVPAVVYKKGFLAGYDPVLDVTVAALGNTNTVVSTMFLMPGQQGNVVHADDLEKLEQRLLDAIPTTPTWNRVLRTLLPRTGLELQIPRFSHKSTFNTSSTLKKMGLRDLFDGEHADLGGLNGPSKDLYLSDMVQLNTFVTCGEGMVGEQHHIEEYPETLSVAQRRRARWLNDWDEPRDYQRAFHDPHDISDAMHLPLHLRPRQARLPARSTQPARLKFDRPFLYFVRHNPSGMILYFGRYNPRLLP